MSVRVRVGGAVSGAGPRSADDGVTHGESLQTPSLLTPGPGARGGAETIIMRTQNVEQERAEGTGTNPVTVT